MVILLKRVQGYKEYTLGLLKVDGELVSFTLEDQEQEEKVYGETRIPAGVYPVKLRKAGRINSSYNRRFPWHNGVLHITDIPGFKYVYLHIGNTDDHTLGCPLVADSHVLNKAFVGQSTVNYERFYKMVQPALVKGEKVFIVVQDEGELTTI